MPDDADDTIYDLATQLQQSQLACRLAQEMARFQAGLLGRVAHELRSPLNRILGIHQMILADLCDSPEEEREFLAQSQAAAQQLLQLLTRVSDLSKLAYGTEKLDIQPLQVQGILQNVADRTQLQFANRNLRLQIAAVDPDWYVLADPVVLLQVLVNLVETPIAYLERGTIAIAAALKDTGIPTSEAHPPQVSLTIAGAFPTTLWPDPITMLPSPSEETDHPSPSHQPPPDIWPSLGLSLTINQTLLELMGGQLDVIASETGTQLRCMLPLCPLDDELF
ncbi:hypothetical protein OOK60_12120 [Trichothermofontia sichuanensis B231]|uniref:sensor histidine kinase n=1 Tax=Trichothermofontia sichuanensis TaxID=3045816 RepID=UPI00224573EF|nr:histidine kinase dimerization/phospho-acceptor domain-containing protein [Trichothermofontia sichuanensis]UZQ53250.1 hypothetical protein OOK60_12120 [Trichothermofontia sichuanensis B231]